MLILLTEIACQFIRKVWNNIWQDPGYTVGPLKSLKSPGLGSLKFLVNYSICINYSKHACNGFTWQPCPMSHSWKQALKGAAQNCKAYVRKFRGKYGSSIIDKFLTRRYYNSFARSPNDLISTSNLYLSPWIIHRRFRAGMLPTIDRLPRIHGCSMKRMKNNRHRAMNKEYRSQTSTNFLNTAK